MEPLRCQSIYTERPVKVICIGAGASGLLLAYKLNKHCRNVELIVSSIAAGNFVGEIAYPERFMRRTKISLEHGMRTTILGQWNFFSLHR